MHQELDEPACRLDATRREALFQRALARSPVMLWSQDPDLRITWVCNSFIGDDAAVVGLRDVDLLPPAEAAALVAAKTQVLADGDAIRLCIVMPMPDGERAIEMSIEPMASAAGRPEALICCAIDVSEARRNIDELREARRRAELAVETQKRFIAAVSHDLRQPLQAARLFHAVLEHGLTAQEHRRSVDRLGTSLDAAADMLANLLDQSRLEAGIVDPEARPLPLAPILDELVEENRPVAARKGIELRAVHSSAVVWSDPILLRRVLANLLSNAVRHTRRGRVLIGCRRLPAGRVRVEVLDTGPGVPSAEVPRLFELFYRGKDAGDGGTGLGLSIVARLCRLLDHPVTVRSEPGKGSAFGVVLSRFA